ncbi:ATP-binding cassette domain-containing protein [Ligilactobacillus murinus]|nr:ATP-binding cassette domain-containing protein [Ligilactobacillus murinus]MBF0833451.1 ATP-binding cassette domain-containing protein [Ligilactobacillus murinus]TFU65712.1 ATP-binding cassette domain-containing protein [Ligilactobacillus murinus]TGY53543.1 ATP-binding cassette domain-containing protein [Ligilactobacillus murinus]
MSGQKQRICLARALLSKPEVLILDESTSNLDQRAEVSIMTELFKENRTLLVIAHRLQVSEIADRVIVLKNGIISETGTFTNLNHPGTYFFDLLNAQFETKNTKKRTKK